MICLITKQTERIVLLSLLVFFVFFLFFFAAVFGSSLCMTKQHLKLVVGLIKKSDD